jgi:hypothetical protein
MCGSNDKLCVFFFANRTLALKETLNSTKHLKKNENYNKILEKPFIFNLQTVSTARRRCRSFLSRPDVIDCGREVAERVKKTTFVPKTKKEELSMKFLDDPKIPTVRQNPRRPHHSHKPLDVTAEMWLKPGRPYCTRRRHHHLSAAPTNFNPKKKNGALKIEGGVLLPTRAEIHHVFMAQKPQRRGELRRRRREAGTQMGSPRPVVSAA